MSGDDYEITMDDAHEIVRRVVGNDGVSPLIGKEEKLYKALLHTQRVHKEALDIDTLRRDHKPQVTKLRNALKKALKELDDTPINLTFFDPELDELYTDPNSQRDLRGLLRRALKLLKDKDEAEGELHYLMDRRGPDGKVPRAVRSHLDKISTVGIRAVVEVLRHFWNHETDLPFLDDFEKSLDDRGKDGPLKPKGLAAKFVYETARLIDPDYTYTAEACSNAMRPR